MIYMIYMYVYMYVDTYLDVYMYMYAHWNNLGAAFIEPR